ncbi:hypothetical protein EMPG_10670 [Blastomyces silverae]|uniref:Uncharacterized protein n=1 Tax=Blastomyces silverae TaxID=2060906 RepID=A0A0H1B3F8_9EURO|nr:hypothetical protein EMPG_10670 [Blastomyces silverae]
MSRNWYFIRTQEAGKYLYIAGCLLAFLKSAETACFQLWRDKKAQSRADQMAHPTAKHAASYRHISALANY